MNDIDVPTWAIVGVVACLTVLVFGLAGLCVGAIGYGVYRLVKSHGQSS